jgi:hypothetical protein
MIGLDCVGNGPNRGPSHVATIDKNIDPGVWVGRYRIRTRIGELHGETAVRYVDGRGRGLTQAIPACGSIIEDHLYVVSPCDRSVLVIQLAYVCKRMGRRDA